MIRVSKKITMILVSPISTLALIPAYVAKFQSVLHFSSAFLPLTSRFNPLLTLCYWQWYWSKRNGQNAPTHGHRSNTHKYPYQCHWSDWRTTKKKENWVSVSAHCCLLLSFGLFVQLMTAQWSKSYKKVLQQAEVPCSYTQREDMIFLRGSKF